MSQPETPKGKGSGWKFSYPEDPTGTCHFCHHPIHRPQEPILFRRKHWKLYTSRAHLPCYQKHTPPPEARKEDRR